MLNNIYNCAHCVPPAILSYSTHPIDQITYNPFIAQSSQNIAHHLPDNFIIQWRLCREGVFAAGDATTVPYKQIIIAMGEGAKASLGAFDYLIRKQG